MNTSRRCLFVLGVVLAATAPAYSQGHIVPDGVTYSSAGLSAVVHVMRSSTNGDYTGFILRPRFMTPGSPYYTIFSFDPAFPDEGVRTFFVSQNDPISLEPVQAAAYTELVLGNYYGFDPGVPFYLGFYTGHTNGAPPGAYSNPVFGWGEFVNNQGVIQMLDGALEAEGGGLYAGTRTIIPIPEPGILSLSACGALILGWRFRRLNPRGGSDHGGFRVEAVKPNRVGRRVNLPPSTPPGKRAEVREERGFPIRKQGVCIKPRTGGGYSCPLAGLWAKHADKNVGDPSCIGPAHKDAADILNGFSRERSYI